MDRVRVGNGDTPNQLEPMPKVLPMLDLKNGFSYPCCPICQAPVDEVWMRRLKSPSAHQPGQSPAGVQMWVTWCRGSKCLKEHSLGVWRVYTIDARRPSTPMARLTTTILPKLGESPNHGVRLTLEKARLMGNPLAES